MEFEGIAISLLWGSLLTHYLWFRKGEIYNSVKHMTISGVKKLWHGSKSIINAKLSKRIKSTPQIEDIKSIQNIQTNKDEQISNDNNKNEDLIFSKQKRIKKKHYHRPKNLRKIAKRYEDWLMSRREIRKLKESPIMKEEQLKKIASRKSTDNKDMEIAFAKQKIDQFQEGFKSFQEYLQPNELLSIANMNAYNPLIESVSLGGQKQSDIQGDNLID